MNDIFYLSISNINLVELLNNLTLKTSEFKILYSSIEYLQIEYDGKKYDFTTMNVDEFVDEEDITFINQNKIKTIICISHHTKAIPCLIVIMKMILRLYGGWVGNDSDGFFPVYDLTTIDSFSYGLT